MKNFIGRIFFFIGICMSLRYNQLIQLIEW